MDKQIICSIEPGLSLQHVYFYENGQEVDSEGVHLGDLAHYLTGVCESEQCYNLHLFGADSYVAGIVNEIVMEENLKYNSNKIKIEVN